MIYKAVIFDLDGTLVDTLIDLADAVNSALAQFVQPTHPVDAYRSMIGNGARTLVQRALPPNRSELIDLVLEASRRHYSCNCLQNSRLYDGINTVVLRLRSKGLRLAVLSNKDQQMTERIVNHFFSTGVFDIVRGSQPSCPLKPDPACTNEIIAAIQLPRSEFLLIGDSAVDIATAKAANITSVGVSWGFRSKAELIDSQADIIIDKPAEILKIIA
ncbi:MAG: HAD-IA family hydrolase [Planctomycetota bacterium]